MSRFARKMKAPEGFEYIEPVLTTLEEELREKVNEPHEGKRKCESLWPVHQINWQRSRYIYDMFYIYKHISREVYDYCIRMKFADAALIAKWKKPGYERLCCTFVINQKNYKFGTTSICRVPKQYLSKGTIVEDVTTGCMGCASGPGGQRNIFGNKYGQYLAAIQVEREAAAERAEEAGEEAKTADDYGTVWAVSEAEANLAPHEGGQETGAARREAQHTLRHLGRGGGVAVGDDDGGGEGGGKKRRKTHK